MGTHIHTPLSLTHTYIYTSLQAYVYALGMTMFGALQNGVEDQQVSKFLLYITAAAV